MYDSYSRGHGTFIWGVWPLHLGVCRCHVQCLEVLNERCNSLLVVVTITLIENLHVCVHPVTINSI